MQELITYTAAVIACVFAGAFLWLFSAAKIMAIKRIIQGRK